MLGLGKSKEKKQQQELHDSVVLALKNVFDPEIPVNIYDLGLIYNILINSENDVHIQMTLTTPGCPVAHTFPGMIEAEVKQVEAINDVSVELVWDPPWTQERMTEAARLELGLL